MNITHRFYLSWEFMVEPVICYNKVWGLFKNLIFSYAIKDAATNLQIGFETAANIVNICKPKTKTIPLLWISLFFSSWIRVTCPHFS